MAQYAIIKVRSSEDGWATPIVERVPGGWQSGAHHYPDEDVLTVMRLGADPVIAELERVREDKRILQEVAQELGGIVDAVTAELGTRRDAGPDTIVAAIRALRGHPMSTHMFTPDQITVGIRRALSERELDVIPGLIQLLAVQDPARAQTILDAIDVADALHNPAPKEPPNA